MTYRKMTDADVKRVLDFLISRETATRLTWRDVEEFSGFTRQALQARVDVKGAYDVAKKCVRSAKSAMPIKPDFNAAADERLLAELTVLRARVEQLEYRETLWKRRWYRIAYNVRQQGYQMVDIDKVIPLDSQGMTGKQVGALLAPFDEEIPPVASRSEN